MTTNNQQDDKMRATFEVTCDGERATDRDNSGEYVLMQTYRGWVDFQLGWQAALASREQPDGDVGWRLMADKLAGHLNWFCLRVDSGEVRSKRTYNEFKEALADYAALSTNAPEKVGEQEERRVKQAPRWSTGMAIGFYPESDRRQARSQSPAPDVAGGMSEAANIIHCMGITSYNDRITIPDALRIINAILPHLIKAKAMPVGDEK